MHVRNSLQPDADKVLVLGTDARVSLAVARSLGRHQIEVHLGWCLPGSLAVHSRYVAKVHDIPPYSQTDDTWKRTLLSLCHEERFALVMPCNDAAVVPLQKHREELRTGAPIYLLNDRAFDVAFDKFKTNELARSLGIRVPREIRATRATPVPSILASFRLPVVIKPRASATTDDILNKKCVVMAQTPSELSDLLGSLPPDEEVLVQEHFVGQGAGVEVLADRGEILVAFQHVRVHETLDGGSTYRKSVPLDSALLDATRKLLAALDYTGVAMIEFRVDPERGDWVLLEINGRFWGSLPLAVAAGADFPYYLYQLLVHGVRSFPQTYRMDARCRNLTPDLRWLRQRLRGDRTQADPDRMSRGQLIQESFRLLSFRDHVDMLTRDDPLPGLLEMWEMVRRVPQRVACTVLRPLQRS